MKIAVVGAGISGITAALLLSRQHDVHLFEHHAQIGGHTNTRTVRDPKQGDLAIDTGFIVCNPRNYPNFYRLLSFLGVALQDSEMSFGYHDLQSGFRYTGPLLRYSIRRPENFAQKSFWRLLREQQRFNFIMRGIADSLSLNDEPLGPHLRSLGISSFFINEYVAPLIASIWSSPESDVETFPLRTFVVFFRNHSMFELSRIPRWQTVVGGSQAYLGAFERAFKGTIHRATPVTSVKREPSGVRILTPGATHLFDKAILAAHADQSLALLADPSEQERVLLGYWRYNKNQALLHTDRSALGGTRRDWASWNYTRDGREAEAPVAITYYMNRLQRLHSDTDYFVTLNPLRPIDPLHVLYQTSYEHPVYTPEAPGVQRELSGISGERHTHFCGAYLGYGFHEDGVNSALAVVRHFGVSL